MTHALMPPPFPAARSQRRNQQLASCLAILLLWFNILPLRIPMPWFCVPRTFATTDLPFALYDLQLPEINLPTIREKEVDDDEYFMLQRNQHIGSIDYYYIYKDEYEIDLDFDDLFSNEYIGFEESGDFFPSSQHDKCDRVNELPVGRTAIPNIIFVPSNSLQPPTRKGESESLAPRNTILFNGISSIAISARQDNEICSYGIPDEDTEENTKHLIKSEESPLWEDSSGWNFDEEEPSTILKTPVASNNTLRLWMKTGRNFRNENDDERGNLCATAVDLEMTKAVEVVDLRSFWHAKLSSY